MVARQPMLVKSYSTNRGAVRLIVVHMTEGATTGQALYNHISNPNNGASYHCAADNHAQNRVFEYVKRNHSAWGQASANSVAVCCAGCGPSGASNSWSRSYWLDRQGWMLDSIAGWIAEEARAYGLPIVKLSASQAQGTGRGVCSHADLGGWGSGGAGRSDPGAGFPWDYVLAKASGTKPPAGGGGGSAPPSTGTAPRLSVDYFGQKHNPRVADVRTWQARMRERGWVIDVDQIYGPGSERVCRQFQAEKRIAVDGLVGPNTWAQAWTAAVT
jgi:peptidoglycan hydrolase-like protein with peptidoglycan-binding domain